MAGSRILVRSHLGQLVKQGRTSSQWPPQSTRLQAGRHFLQSRMTAGQKSFRRTFYSSSTSDDSNTTPIPSSTRDVFLPLDTFARRHIGPSPSSMEQMLKALDPPAKTLDEFVKQVLPGNILSSTDLKIDGPAKREPCRNAKRK